MIRVNKDFEPLLVQSVLNLGTVADRSRPTTGWICGILPLEDGKAEFCSSKGIQRESLLLKIFSAMEMAMINWASTGHSVFLFSSKMLAGRHHDKIIYDKVKKQKLMVGWNWRFQCGQFIELMACEVTCAHYCHVKEGELFTSNSALSLSSYVVTGDQGGDSQALHIGRIGRTNQPNPLYVTTIPNLNVPKTPNHYVPQFTHTMLVHC